MTTIYYDSINPFAGIAPTPFVGRSAEMIQYGDRWGEVETLTLRGTITGHCSTFAELVAKQDTLIARFGKDFQTFQIKDDATTVFSRPYARLVGISFDSSNYSYNLPFQIVLQAYPSDYFEGQYGILDPKDEFSYTQTRNGVTTISHVISARGFNTSASSTNNALENARLWVQARQGLANRVLPAFMAENAGNTPCLLSSGEIINRMAGTYEIRETYVVDALLTGYGLLRYTTDYSYSLDSGISTVDVRGTVVGCKNGTIEQVRARYLAFNAYQEALTQYRKITTKSDLNSTPTTKGISEDVKTRTISFSYTFTDDLAPLTHFDYRVSFDYDFEQDLISASIEGTVSSRVEASIRWATVLAYAASINLYSLILPMYLQYSQSLGITYPLNPVPTSTSRTENEYNYEIGLSARYDNRVIAPLGLDEWDYSIQVTPALHQYGEVPCLDGLGKYVTFDLGLVTRKHVQIEGTALASISSSPLNAAAAVKNQIRVLQIKYANGLRASLDGQSITYDSSSFGLVASASASFSCEDSAFTI